MQLPKMEVFQIIMVDKNYCMRGSGISRKHFPDYLFFFGVIVPLFAVFSSSRIFGTGADYEGYLAIFYGKESTEPAFRFLKIINSTLNAETVTLAFVYFVCSFTGLYLKGVFYKRYSNSFLLSVFLYICTIYFLHEYTQIRAAIGLGICFLTIEEIDRRDFKKFALKIFFAMCFHYSSVIMFPVYFYCNFFRKPKRYLQILWISFIVCVLINKILHGATFLDYFGATFYKELFFARKMGPLDMEGFSVFNIGYFLILVINTIYYFVYKGFKRKGINFLIFQLSSLSSIAFYFLFNIGLKVVTFRLSEFFIPFLFIVIPKIIAKFKEKFLLSPFVLIVLFYFSRTYLKAAF